MNTFPAVDDILKQQDAYWSQRYEGHNSPWDIGYAAPALLDYCRKLLPDTRILIPGCGNAYEAEWLLVNGFTSIHLLDVSASVTAALTQRFSGEQAVRVFHEDFFQHQGLYDVILEQTFFCALPPALRQNYVAKTADLLQKGGKLVGVLFNRPFEGGPPFGGSADEYKALFSKRFIIKKMEPCYNSIAPRRGTELFVEFEKP